MFGLYLRQGGGLTNPCVEDQRANTAVCGLHRGYHPCHILRQTRVRDQTARAITDLLGRPIRSCGIWARIGS